MPTKTRKAPTKKEYDGAVVHAGGGRGGKIYYIVIVMIINLIQ